MSVHIRRKSRFHSLCDDEEDGKASTKREQSRFIVSYLGQTAWREDFTYVNEILENILPELPKQVSGKFWSKKETQRKAGLFIDVGSRAVCIENTEGLAEKCFKFCNIKEVIYCGNTKQYSKHVIFVVGDDTDVTMAHIFVCGSVKEAKRAFKMFTDTFTYPSSEEQPDPQVEANVIGNYVGGIASPFPQETGRQNSLSEVEPISSPEVDDNVVENAFTALARSRSFNSGHSNRYTPGPGAKREQLRRPYSLHGGSLY